MSIFIGSNGNNKVLHLYNGSTNIEPNVFSGTSFHSGLPYYTLLDTVVFSYTGVSDTPMDTALITINRSYYSASKAITYTNSPCLFVGLKDGVRYFFPTTQGSGAYDAVTGIHTGSVFGQCPTIQLQSTTTAMVSTLRETDRNNLFPFTIWDSITMYVFSDSISEMLNNSVEIDRTDIKINGTSIFTAQYLHFMNSMSDRMNDYDTILAFPSGGVTNNFAHHLNYVTSPNNITCIPAISGQPYQLVQLLNSYAYPIQSTSLLSSNSTISVVKNGISLKQFDGNASFKTLNSIGGVFLAIPAGIVWPNGNVVSSQPTGGALGDTMYIKISGTFSPALYVTPRASVILSPGTSIVVITSHYVSIYGVISADCSVINWTGMSISSSAYTPSNLYTEISILR